MTSLINTSAIDTTYPVAGQDNDTQGFRTNFGSIANNLSIAASEITTLQTGVAALAAFPAPTSEVFYPGTGIAGSKTFVSGSRILTLSGTYGTVSNIKVHFDGVYQGITSILTLVGNVLTFVDPIPVGVGIIYVDGGIMQQVSVPPTGSVGIGQLAPDALTYFQTQINEVTPNSEVFTLGTGSGKFQTGETSITLAGTYGTLENIKVHFGVAYLGIDQLVSLVGHVLTFVNPIPSGVSEIYIDGGSITTLGIPANASIGVAQLAPDTITYIQSQIGVNTNPTSEVFSVGTGTGTFQVGASSITLAGAYGSLNNIRVFFDAAYQGINQLSSLVGNVLTFAAPIPTEITNIYVDGGNLTVVGVPSNGTIGLAQLAPDALNYLSSVSGTAPTLAGPVTVTSTNSTNSIIVNDSGVNGANIKLIGNGSVTPNKFIRSQNGAFQVVNSTYTSAILNLDDYGNLSASTFNGNIPFTQVGTGAVARTVNAKLNESVSVLDFGADPTGVADSTAAIQSALNLANNTPYPAVVLPAGTYKITSTLIIGTAKITGSQGSGNYGSGIPTLFAGNTMNILATYTLGAIVEDIKIDGKSLADWGLVCLEGANRAHVNRVQASNFISYGFVFWATQNTALYDCTSYNCGSGFAFFNGARNCSLFNCGGTGINSNLYFDYNTTSIYGMSTGITEGGNDRISFFGGIYEYAPGIICKNTSSFTSDVGAFQFYSAEFDGSSLDNGIILDTTGCVTSAPTFNFDSCSFTWKDQVTPFSSGVLGLVNFTGKSYFSGGANLVAKGITQPNSIANGIQFRNGTQWNSGNLNPQTGFGLTAAFNTGDLTGLPAFFSNALGYNAETWYTDASSRMCVTGGSSFRRGNSIALNSPLTSGISDITSYTNTGTGALYPSGGITNTKWNSNFNYTGASGASALSLYMVNAGGSYSYMYHGLADAGHATAHWALGFNNGVNYQEYLKCSYSDGHFTPGTDNAQTLGSSALRWSTIYAGTGAINTSDARSKQQVRTITEQENLVAVRLKGMIRAFKFNEAVEAKADGARIHFGVIAQDVKAAFEAEGLVAEQYAILCHDVWEDEFKTVTSERQVTLESGEVSTEQYDTGEKVLVRKAGDRFGIRYDELFAFIISAL